MNDFKTLLVGHVSPRLQERNYAQLLQEKLRDRQLQTSDRPPGSYLLVNIPSQKERRGTRNQVRSKHNSRDQTGDIR